jgi:hypothetical protein
VTLDRFQPYEIPSDDDVLLRLCFVEISLEVKSNPGYKDDLACFHGHTAESPGNWRILQQVLCRAADDALNNIPLLRSER